MGREEQKVVGDKPGNLFISKLSCLFSSYVIGLAALNSSSLSSASTSFFAASLNRKRFGLGQHKDLMIYNLWGNDLKRSGKPSIYLTALDCCCTVCVIFHISASFTIYSLEDGWNIGKGF